MLVIFKYWEENTAGTIIKNINGLVIPPVKKNRNPSWIISKLKYIVEIKLLIWFSLIRNCKYKLVKILNSIIKIQSVMRGVLQRNTPVGKSIKTILELVITVVIYLLLSLGTL